MKVQSQSNETIVTSLRVKITYEWKRNPCSQQKKKTHFFLTTYLLTLKVTVAIKVNAIAFLKSTLNKLWNGDCSKWNNFLVPLLHVHSEWLVWSISEVMTPSFLSAPTPQEGPAIVAMCYWLV